jgi:SAM-dependent methyltransferase
MSKRDPQDLRWKSPWSASRVAEIIQMQAIRLGDSRNNLPPSEENTGTNKKSEAPPYFSRGLIEGWSLNQLVLLDHHEFVDNAYRVLLGRPPTAVEHAHMLTALLRGDAKTWLLGSLRYCPEGCARGVPVGGELRYRYLAQRLFRVPGVGRLLEWIAALWRLPTSLRYFRAKEQMMAGNVLSIEQTIRALAAEGTRSMRTNWPSADEIHDELVRLEGRQDTLLLEIEQLRHEHVMATMRADETRARLEALSPPPLGDSLEVVGQPLVPVARERAGISEQVPMLSLTREARYALFQTVFYESAVVAVKQRVYLPYLNRELTKQWPFLDLGCGRGEFLRILRSDDVSAVGVDNNPTNLDALRADGFDVVEQDLLEFLKTDSRTFSGASALQVAEHLESEQIQRMLALLASRLAPGAVLILETPNPLSPYALGLFHTDPTHKAPIPPERLRFDIEAAGFERSRTLFQARIPGNEFAGPDPRAYYADYAIIAYRSEQ